MPLAAEESPISIDFATGNGKQLFVVSFAPGQAGTRCEPFLDELTQARFGLLFLVLAHRLFAKFAALAGHRTAGPIRRIYPLSHVAMKR